MTPGCLAKQRRHTALELAGPRARTARAALASDAHLRPEGSDHIELPPSRPPEKCLRAIGRTGRPVPAYGARSHHRLSRAHRILAVAPTHGLRRAAAGYDNDRIALAMDGTRS